MILREQGRSTEFARLAKEGTGVIWLEHPNMNLSLDWLYVKLWYDYRQGARHYYDIGDGCDDPSVTVLVIESQRPFDSAVIHVPSDIVMEGYSRAREIAMRYRACEVDGVFPGRYWRGAELVLPPWHGQEDAVDMEGCDNERL